MVTLLRRTFLRLQQLTPAYSARQRGGIRNGSWARQVIDLLKVTRCYSTQWEHQFQNGWVQTCISSPLLLPEEMWRGSLRSCLSVSRSCLRLNYYQEDPEVSRVQRMCHLSRATALPALVGQTSLLLQQAQATFQSVASTKLLSKQRKRLHLQM